MLQGGVNSFDPEINLKYKVNWERYTYIDIDKEIRDGMKERKMDIYEYKEKQRNYEWKKWRDSKLKRKRELVKERMNERDR